MASGHVSVAQAAEMLGVHPQRIHQRIRGNSLPARKVGNQWIIEANDVRRINHAGPGRPLSSKSAWDLFAVAVSEQAASELSPSARSRARSRLRNLIDLASSADLDEAAAHVMHALGNRAQRALFVASSRDLPDILNDERIHLSGVSLPESNMSAPDLVEGYVAPRDLDDFVDGHLLSEAPRARANVILHVVPSDVEKRAHVALDDAVRSPLALAADLAEHDGVREKSEAIRAVAELHDQFIHNVREVGADRG